LQEALKAHKDKSSTPVIDNQEADAVLNEEMPKAKKSAKQRKKEKRNRENASLIKIFFFYLHF
jgi:hypothetical protein